MISTINTAAITLSIIISAAIPAHNILAPVFNNTGDVYMYTLGFIPARVSLLRSFKAEAAWMHPLIPAKTLNSEQLMVFFSFMRQCFCDKSSRSQLSHHPFFKECEFIFTWLKLLRANTPHPVNRTKHLTVLYRYFNITESSSSDYTGRK